VDPTALIQQGTAAVRTFVTPEQLPGVLEAYNTAITSTFYVAASTAACGFVAGSFIQWNSVKAKEPVERGNEKSNVAGEV
jgi:hypothetical protein